MNRDNEQLRLLSIFHYVVAGLAALFACIPIIYLVNGLMFASFLKKEAGMKDGMPAFIGWFFIAFTGVFISLGWTFAICMAVAGRFLACHRHYMYCLIMAALACMFMPFGIVLGIFTIIVLIRPSVKESFARCMGQS